MSVPPVEPLPDGKAKIPLKTQLEMARGALGRTPTDIEAITFVRRLGRAANGERRIRDKLPPLVYLSVYFPNSHDKETARVVIIDSQKRDTEFTEHVDEFPSDTLMAQIMLVAQ